MTAPSLAEAAVAVLACADPAEKVRETLRMAALWQAGGIDRIGAAAPLDHPGRPAKPEILAPNKMRRRGTGGVAGRIALLHALAHIEFNAIDLAWDIVARFTAEDLPKGFYDDWVLVARQEAEHFQALEELLQGLGSGYGALPAHGGLWQAADKTATDLRARLAIVPMTLEARALDTAPVSIAKLDDPATVAVLSKIVAEEVDHVAAGVRWFNFLCARDGRDPAEAFQALVRQHFPGGLKRPFNAEARERAGMPAHYYEPLAAAGN